MAFDEELAIRVRHALAAEGWSPDERTMFGGLAFMVRGHMTVGVMGQDLMVRVGPDGHDDALAQRHARVMDFTGRPSRGMVYVGPRGVATDADLHAWVRRGLDFTTTLPPK